MYAAAFILPLAPIFILLPHSNSRILQSIKAEISEMNKSEWPQETKKKKKSFENNSRIQLIFGFRGRWSLQHYERYIILLIKKQAPV